MMSDRLFSKKIRTLAWEYSKKFAGLRRLLIRHRPRICPFDDILHQAPQNASVFDIGCGSGFILYAFAKLNGARKIKGVDANAQLVADARHLLSSLIPSADLNLLATHSPEQWPQEVFEVVTMVDVLHHIPVHKQTDFIKAAAARVAPGGMMIYKDMASRPFWYGFANRMHDLLLARQWIHYVPIEHVSRTLTELGFSKKSQKNRIMWWYAHQMVVMVRPPSQIAS